jgi:hypothetical protein
LGLQGSTTQVVKVFSPQFSAEKCILVGTVDEMVDQLINKLEELL